MWVAVESGAGGSSSRAPSAMLNAMLGLRCEKSRIGLVDEWFAHMQCSLLRPCTRHISPGQRSVPTSTIVYVAGHIESGVWPCVEERRRGASGPLFVILEPSGRCAICSPDLATPSFFAKPLRLTTRRLPPAVPEFGVKVSTALPTRESSSSQAPRTPPFTRYSARSIRPHPLTPASIRAVASLAALQLPLYYSTLLSPSIPCQPSLCDKP
jgi:hypothetical protein